ncbi:MAG TPA: hypothetical protein VHJ76_02540 [Actinomycetota bacterium]|nr:hypothetical protein [Actinomycetota bacterium]
MKKLVAACALATALLFPAAGVQAAEPDPASCRVCVSRCGYGYLVYWYDLDGRQEVLLNACIYH